LFEIIDKENVLEILGPNVTRLGDNKGIITMGSELNVKPWLQPLLEAQRLETLQQVLEWMEKKVSWGLEAKALRAAIKTQGIDLEVE